MLGENDFPTFFIYITHIPWRYSGTYPSENVNKINIQSFSLGGKWVLQTSVKNRFFRSV